MTQVGSPTQHQPPKPHHHLQFGARPFHGAYGNGRAGGRRGQGRREGGPRRRAESGGEATITAVVEFEGLQPWPRNVEVIECVTEGRVFDLHNACTLESVTTTCTPDVALHLRFLEDASRRSFDIVFSAVQQLRFEQDDVASTPGDWHPRDVETFIGLQVSDQGQPRFDVETIVGQFSFTCSHVAFVERDD